MMRQVSILGIAALVLISSGTEARAGLFGGHRPASEDRDGPGVPDGPGDGEDSYNSRAHRGGMRVREVPRRARAGEDEDRPAPRERDRELDRERPRDLDEERPRTARRLAEAASDESAEGETARFQKKMADLQRQLEEAEQAENARKIKAVKWMIEKEEQRHEKSLEAASRAPRNVRKKTGPSYEPPDERDVDHGAARADRLDRGDRFEKPARTASRRRDDDLGGDERSDRLDRLERPARPVSRRRDDDLGGDEPRERDREPVRTARHEDDEVSNPLKERSKRRDDGGWDRRRADRDEDEQDRGRERRPARSSNAARVERAEGSIRRY